MDSKEIINYEVSKINKFMIKENSLLESLNKLSDLLKRKPKKIIGSSSINVNNG
jgi:hypothetical protein